MRMHFRPRLASYYKAGAVLGAIIASFYLCDFEALLLTRAGNRAASTVGVVVEPYPCSCQVRQTSRRGVCQRQIAERLLRSSIWSGRLDYGNQSLSLTGACCARFIFAWDGSK